jgi:DNA processing protein
MSVVTKSFLSDDHLMAASLTALPKIGPKRLLTLLKYHDPKTAWAVVQGRAKPHEVVAALMHESGLGAMWRANATRDLQEQILARCKKASIHVVLHGESNYPSCLKNDFAPPAVLFYLGDLSALNARRVGMVGTRSATASGRYFASHLAFELTQNGISVVSGLARGIDAWSHRGALRALEKKHSDEKSKSKTFSDLVPPIGVVASGLDYVYPKENGELWRQVAQTGVLLSESSPGAPPEAFRFPLRNRILAAISEVLVVVESRDKGGSMITVDEAQKRDITVLAVPGSPRNIASVGTNSLVQQGCIPVVGVDDVLVALGLDNRRANTAAFDPRPRLSEQDAHLVAVMVGAPFSLDEFVIRTGVPLLEAAISLGRLEALGWVVNNSGWWEVIEFG